MSRAMLPRRAEVAPAAPSKTVVNNSSDALRVGEPNDAFEREADRAADEVVTGNRIGAAWSLSRMSVAPPLQRQCACGGECDDRKKGAMLQRKAATGSSPGVAPPVVQDALRSPGRQLDPAARAFMESRFGHDFGRVRVHTDDTAARSAQAVAATAYTVGAKIIFDRGRYSPQSDSGRRLLAHELAHVVQQEGVSKSVVQRDSDTDEGNEGPQSKSVLSQALRAADQKRWEDAARLANGLSPDDLRAYIRTQQILNPQFVYQLHLGALGARGVGKDSAVAQATETAYAAIKHKEEVHYARELAKQNGTPPPENEAAIANMPAPRPLSVQEKKAQCARGEPAGLKVFPLRMPHGLWRISVAPISAQRDGKEIVVKQPLNGVFADPKFHREVKTLPLSTFTGGLHLQPDEVVRVRLYDDNERLICVTGQEMLRLSDATDTAVLISILGTVLDAATVLAPGASAGLSRGANLAIAGGTIAATGGLEVARQASAVHYGLQDEIDWGGIVFDTLLQVATLGGGSLLTNAAVKQLAVTEAGTYARPLVKLAVEAVISGGIASLQVVARALFEQLRGRGQKMTVEEFIVEVGKQFATGVLLHAVMSQLSPGHGAAHPPNEGGTAPRPEERHPGSARAIETPSPPARGVPHNEIDLGRPSTKSLELNPKGGSPSAHAAPHNEIDLGRPITESLELNPKGGSPSARAVPHNVIDLGADAGGAKLEKYTGKKATIPDVKRPKPVFGEPSIEQAGTGSRKGIHFHEYNAAEISQGLRVDNDPVAGRPRSASYRVDAGTAKRTAPVGPREFTKDVSVEGAQSRDSAYTNSGYERGHLAQREAFNENLMPEQEHLPQRHAVEGNLSAHKAADQFTNVVPMRRGLNRGPAWRAAEIETMKLADTHGSVNVRVEPVYDTNPPQLPDGTPIPKEIIRTVTKPDGTPLPQASGVFPNQ